MKRKGIIIVVVIAAALCLLLCIGLKHLPRTESSAREYFTVPEERIGTEAYVSPADFEGLRKINEDIYAWLYIPGTEISYPILQSPDDDAYYLQRNMYGRSDAAGAIYTEAAYSGKEFTDPVTVVYGQNTADGEMFGALQRAYSSREALEEHSEIVVYLPDRELRYTVFAAVPFDNRHILYNYDFTDQRTFRLFFKEILSVRSLEASFAEDASVQEGDTILILSTHLKSDSSKRFLVCAKLSRAAN